MAQRELINSVIQIHGESVGQSPCLMHWQQPLDAQHIPQRQDKKLWGQEQIEWAEGCAWMGLQSKDGSSWKLMHEQWGGNSTEGC